jgi:hypothetical protein
MTNEETFRAQNSINLSMALVAAAFALMAGVVAAFFAVADKIPASAAGVTIIVVTVISMGLCLVSVFFGGRGVSKTLKSIKAAPGTLADSYDGGNFSLQGIFGILGTIAVLVMIGSSAAIRSHPPEADAGADSSRENRAALSAELAKIQTQSAELSGRLDQIVRAQGALAERVAAVEDLAAKSSNGRTKAKRKGS